MGSRRLHAAAVVLAPAQLVELTTFFAAEVAAGQYPFVDFNEQERWHQRIYRDARVDIWLISWLPTQGTQLHDHGGSSGAFTVISGTLTESVLHGRDTDHAGISDLARPAGGSVSFGAHYVHDVHNTSDLPAVSVHAYSRPLTSMNFYDLDDGALVRIASMDTDDPEVEPALERADVRVA